LAHRRASFQIARMKLVGVAGGIVWRETAAGPRIAVVHRARRDDWSLPKGRLDAGEAWQDAARREIAEETGCDVRLERFAGAKLFVDRPEPKLVLYWHARVVHLGATPPDDEVDEVAWLSRREALDRLDHGSDRRLLIRALADGAGPDRTPASFDALDLRKLVILDSRKAEEALPEVLGLIARVAAAGRRTSVGRA
jgi:ADP-ribose pyrophosphatase YjhB (NUDIX family)